MSRGWGVIRGLSWLLLILIGLQQRDASADPAIPPLTGRVVDLAHILSASAERDLTLQLAKVEEESGTQIVIATLPRLDRYSIESWGLALGRGWKIGRAGHDDGIVIVLAPNDREVRVEVGYGLEGRIPDATAFRIIKTYMLPAVREGRYAQGLGATVDALRRVILDPNAAIARPAKGIEIGKFGLIILLGGMAVFVVVVVALSMSFRNSVASPSDDSITDEEETVSSSSTRSWGRSSFSSSSGSSFGGRGGSFGGGGASGKW